MKRIKWLISGLIVLTILCVAVPNVSAQAWDGQWFRLACLLKSYEVDPATGTFEKLNARFTAYLGFGVSTANLDGSRTYPLAVWTETAPDTWTNSFSTNATTIVANENFISDLNLVFVGEGGVFPGTGPYIETYVTPAIIPMRRNISFIATGEVYFGLNDGNQVYGSVTIKGTNVDPSKLPFTPTP
jgi:hypothetical protein